MITKIDKIQILVILAKLMKFNQIKFVIITEEKLDLYNVF